MPGVCSVSYIPPDIWSDALQARVSDGFLCVAEVHVEFVHRVLSVLADEEDAVHRQLSCPASEGLCDRRVDLQLRMPTGALPAEIVVADLLDVERDNVRARRSAGGEGR